MEIKINRFAEKFAKLKFKYTHKIFPISFSDLPDNRRACLICMPGKMDQVRAAAEILPELAEIFPNRDIKILLTTNVDPQSYQFIKKFSIIRPLSEDIDSFSLPKREFIDRLTKGGLAITVDMDTNPNFFNAVISLQTGAPVRTAFDKGEGLPYYNFIVAIPARDAAPKVSYRAMADILRNFKK
ncbi:MAG: hypothetical protein V3W18_02075 [candidate division Zixibacteria bacterium]